MAERIEIWRVEYPVVEHCNLSCAHCDHASPLLPAQCADVDQYRRDLTSLARVLEAEEFSLIGGEPLLHPDLLSLLRIARQSRIAQGITLVTNGTLLHTAPAEMWTLIDKVRISVYPRAAVRFSQEELSQLCARHGVKLVWRDVDSFRQTLLNTKIEEAAVVQRIYERCFIAHVWRCYTIYKGRFYKCAPAPFMSARLHLKGVTFDNHDDGVAIEGNADLCGALEAYLSSEQPLKACSYCLGTSGAEYPHQQLNKRERIDAIARDEGPLDTLIRRESLFNPDAVVVSERPPFRRLTTTDA
jgi:hypothetical protein